MEPTEHIKTEYEERHSPLDIYINPTPDLLYRILSKSNYGHACLLALDNQNIAVTNGNGAIHTDIMQGLRQQCHPLSTVAKRLWLALDEHNWNIVEEGRSSRRLVFPYKVRDKMVAVTSSHFADIPVDRWPTALRRVLGVNQPEIVSDNGIL